MSFDFEMNEEIRQIIEKCQKSEKAQEVVQWLADRCRKEGLCFTDYQWKSLVNHVAAMANRSVTKEGLEIDPELFDEVSAESLTLSQEVVDTIGGIAAEEKYLLSIHFECVREKP